MSSEIPKVYQSSDGFSTVIEIGGKTYVGSGTVWNEYPSGKRYSTRMEEKLSDIEIQHEMRERGSP